MNFRRIEIIFLVTFIAIDIFLFGMFEQNMNMQAENVSQGDSDSKIIKEMKDDQIKVGSLSKKKNFAYYLSGTQNDTLRNQMGQLLNQTPHYVGYELDSEFKAPVKVNKDNPQQSINKLLMDPTFVAFGDQYQYSKDLSTSRSIVYIQKAMGGLMYSTEAQIRFTLNGRYQIVSYTQSYLQDIKSLREKSETISETRALIWLYQYNEIPNNTKVSWAKLGYTKLLSIDDDRVFIPTWIIAIKPQNSPQVQLKKINAFTGGIIKETNENLKNSQSISGVN
ncbi:two-component system regulatory protein YycI [Lentilactobacillus hilgardii]|uniref:two-component system regulatory protein YycI n=1 Tax=Lentilactobacillus hilgardii TaxID=1588 RepID=UPI0021C3266C|nr:two-component system regulatory protein YycI [Lentilactobacillus hilgardii]MCP9333217.1 two-component system regulatory protein YycI [Lentilactobacillus hilgardii]MCP9349850.1 two-component system regulatory protein YycI [Lentilactobacillus hilgardii]MCP9352754.1 two-component system regulatory protein YycI [Lentilactobacillus hilgardii]